MATTGQKIIIVLGLVVMIAGIVGIMNSFSGVKTAEDNFKEACDNSRIAMTELKESIDTFGAAGGDTSAMMADYNVKLKEFNEMCG